MYNIYIGYDPREKLMGQMLEYSILKHSSQPININWIKKNELIKKRYYFRYEKEESHSTEFSITRFLTPFLTKFSGWALFMDIDMLWLDDPIQLFSGYKDRRHSVYCVKHNEYTSVVSTKMAGSGQKQGNFPKKNHSSLMLFNCTHSDCRSLMPNTVSTQSPAYLHQFKWTSENKIGSLPTRYNFLAGEVGYGDSMPREGISNLHFTLFHPELASGPEDINNINCPFADIWYQYYKETFGQEHKYYSKYMELCENKNKEYGLGLTDEEVAQNIIENILVEDDDSDDSDITPIFEEKFGEQPEEQVEEQIEKQYVKRLERKIEENKSGSQKSVVQLATNMKSKSAWLWGKRDKI